MVMDAENKNTKYNRKIAEYNHQIKNKIFCRGFCFTDIQLDSNEYPFYSLWNLTQIDKYRLLVHPQQTFFISENNDLILVGHAYNPITMEYDEIKIVNELSGLWKEDKETFYKKLNELTGIFTIIIIQDNTVYIFGDATCMQTTFYLTDSENIFISSHANLISDILKLEWDEYIKELVDYRFFKLFGAQLPGDLSQFKNVKRLVPNHHVKIENKFVEVKRFYWPHYLEIEQSEIVKQTEKLLHNNLELITKKWKRPAISLTGGCDSKTTLACANGLYDKFHYFSYVSSEEEKVDAIAAKEICKAIGLKHDTYNIPTDDTELENITDTREIIFHNDGSLRKNNSNDIRKRAWFAKRNLFDIEVKSWASEIGRAYYSKRFNGLKDFGKTPTPRKCTTLYKVFVNNRKLVKQTDKVFKDYLDKYFEQDANSPLPWQEQFFWEFRVSAWNALVITGEHRYSYNITIPYNNRLILELLLSAPLEERINDVIYKKIREEMNANIDAINISVQNVKHTNNRAKAEKIYYQIHSRIKI